MQALDLRDRPPRSGYVELDGLLFLARTIDKLRSQLPGGNPGQYFINGDMKGLSGFLLEQLGIDEADLLEAVRTASDDDEVARWVRTHSDAARYPAINETLRRIKPKHAGSEAGFRKIYAPTLAEHPDLERILDIIDADDRRTFRNAADPAR